VGLLVAVLALVTAGCAGVPERGPVVAAGRVEPPRVPLFANPPKSGDTAEGIVKGFLDAGRDFHQNHAVARQFVADGGSRWQALAPVVVLDREPCIRLVSVDGVPVPGADTKRCTLPAGVRAEPAPKLPKPRDGQTATVRVEGDIQARIDGLGRYSMTAEPMPDYEHDLTLIARKGEWRITAPPDGLVLVASLLQFTFSPVPLYFPQRLGDPGAGDADAGDGADPSVSTWLVPDVRWFPSDLEPPAIA
jgi:hypothetical protein